jgi:hypothetical protein
MAAHPPRFLALATLVVLLVSSCSAQRTTRDKTRNATVVPSSTSNDLLDKAAYLGCFDLSRLDGLDLQKGEKWSCRYE